MAIPEGYRLLTNEDVGKVFGTDLEQVIYFDTSANMSSINTSATWIGGVIKSTQRDQLTMVFDSVLVWDKRYASVPSPYWIYDTYTIPSGTEITSYFTSGASWNNTFLYVKEKVAEVSNPYSIKIKNKNGIKLLTKDKKLTDDVTITIDENLLGGGEKVGIVTYTINYDIQGNGILYISDGYQVAEEITGQGTLTIVGGYALNMYANGYGFGGGSLVLGGTDMDDFSHNFYSGGGTPGGTVYMSNTYMTHNTPLSVTIDITTYED